MKDSTRCKKVSILEEEEGRAEEGSSEEGRVEEGREDDVARNGNAQEQNTLQKKRKMKCALCQYESEAYNVRRHMKNVHRNVSHGDIDSIMEEEKIKYLTSKGKQFKKFDCCGFITTVGSRRQHQCKYPLPECNDSRREIERMYLRCCMCGERMLSQQAYSRHFSANHVADDIAKEQLSARRLQFPSFPEYELWKDSMLVQSVSTMNLYSTTKNQNSEVRSYRCHRVVRCWKVNECDEIPKKSPRYSRHTESSCPAFLKEWYWPNGSISVEYVLYHSHTLDAALLRLSELQKKEVVSMLQEHKHMSIHDIVKKIRSRYDNVPDNRMHWISDSDVRNLKTQYIASCSQLSKNDLESVCIRSGSQEQINNFTHVQLPPWDHEVSSDADVAVVAMTPAMKTALRQNGQRNFEVVTEESDSPRLEEVGEYIQDKKKATLELFKTVHLLLKSSLENMEYTTLTVIVEKLHELKHILENQCQESCLRTRDYVISNPKTTTNSEGPKNQFQFAKGTVFIAKRSRKTVDLTCSKCHSNLVPSAHMMFLSCDQCFDTIHQICHTHHQCLIKSCQGSYHALSLDLTGSFFILFTYFFRC